MRMVFQSCSFDSWSTIPVRSSILYSISVLVHAYSSLNKIDGWGWEMMEFCWSVLMDISSNKAANNPCVVRRSVPCCWFQVHYWQMIWCFSPALHSLLATVTTGTQAMVRLSNYISFREGCKSSILGETWSSLSNSATHVKRLAHKT